MNNLNLETMDDNQISSTRLTKEFYGKEADFFNSGFIKILDIKELDREGRSAVEIIFEVVK